MRVIRVHETGGPQVLRIEESERPEPGPNQVLIAVELAGVSYGDTIVRSGRYPFPLPFVPGTEVGGTVVQVGDEVESVSVGTRVLATTIGATGGYAEFACVDAISVVPLPAGLALEQGLAVFQAGALAVAIVAVMGVRPEDTVLLTAAAGRIGSLMLQSAKARGATVIGAASGARKVAAVSAAGADFGIDYAHPEWPAKVREVTGGRGVDVVIDAVGGTIGAQAVSCAADGRGRVGIYGFSSGSWIDIDIVDLARRGLTVIGPLGIIFATSPAAQRADAERALAAAVEGALIPRIHATYSFEQAARAHAELESRSTIGAVLLAPAALS